MAAIKLAKTTDTNPRAEDAPYQFDRRRSPRQRSTGIAMAMIRDGEGRARVATVQLIDSSTTGLGVMIPGEVHTGDDVTLILDAPCLWAPRGTVVRSERGEDGCRVGLTRVAARV